MRVRVKNVSKAREFQNINKTKWLRMKVPWLKNVLNEREINISGKRKAELIELLEKIDTLETSDEII